MLKKPKLIVKFFSFVIVLSVIISTMQFSVLATDATLTVDLNNEIRDVSYCTSGMLYGTVGEGSPSNIAYSPLKLEATEFGSKSMSQGILDSMAQNGVQKFQFILCNALGGWPYNWTNWDDWYDLIDEQVNMVLDSGYKDKMIYVPWNEADWTWDPDETGVSWNEGWHRMYDRIRALDSTTPIAGPAWAYYDGPTFTSFLSYCIDNSCVPDIFIWHQVRDTTFFDWFHADIADFRTRVSNLSLSDIPVFINEYGSEKDMGQPGSLVGFISRLERDQVWGAQLGSFTPMNDSYDLYDLCGDRLAGPNTPNGAWWLYKWYADMTGKILYTTPPSQYAAGLEGCASVDNNTKKVQVIFGGNTGNTTINVTNFDSRNFFDSTVHVRILRAHYTGNLGPLYEPEFVLEDDYAVTNNQINVTISNTNARDAYQMIITPVGTDYGSAVTRTRYEAEDSTMVDADIYTFTPNPYDGHICSDNQKATDISATTSKLTFDITASTAGRHKVDVYYFTGYTDWSDQWMRLNGGTWEKINYKCTRKWDEIGISTVYLTLSSGSNTLEFMAYNSTGGWANNTVDLDCIDVTYAPDTTPTQRYEAEDTQTTGAATIDWTNSGYTGTGYLGFLGASTASAQFAVVVDKAGYYDVDTSYSAGTYESYSGNRTMELYVDKVKVKDCVFSPSTNWTTWNTKSETIYLQKGINLLTYKSNVYDDYSGVINLNNIEVTYNESTTGIITVEAEDEGNTKSGTAANEANTYASNDYVVSGLGDGSSNTLQFNVSDVPSDGLYKIDFGYSSYLPIGNAKIEINGTHTREMQFFPFTAGYDIFEDIAVIKPLNAGSNTIKLSNVNPDEDAVDIPKIDYLKIIPIVMDNKIISFEAEDAELGGTASVDSNEECSGGESVIDIGNGTANYLKLNNIVGDTTSKYVMTIYYISNSATAIDLTINGSNWTALTLPATGESNNLGSANFEITLNSGLNVLNFDRGTGYYAPEVDKFDIVPEVSEAENAYLEGSAQIQSSENCSGTANVGYIAQGSSNSITFDKVFASTSGYYQMKIFYSAPYNWSADVSVNNGSARTISLPSSGSWTTVSSVTAVITLERGYNTINFSRPTDYYCSDIDKIEVFPVDSTIYEAENASLGGTAAMANEANCSGGKKVGYLGNGTSNYVNFTDVYVATTGNYQLKIFYLCPYDWGTDITTNGSNWQYVSLPNSGSWSTVADETATVYLTAGNNEIKLTRGTGYYNPDIDCIQLYYGT